MGEDVEEAGLLWDIGDQDCFAHPIPGTLKRTPWLDKTGQVYLAFRHDSGPAAAADARLRLSDICERMKKDGRLVYAMEVPAELHHGCFFGPQLFEIDGLERLQREVFGPILHVIRYPANELDKVIAAINHSGYGLTLGIHSRVDTTVQHIQKQVRVGNCYVNRDMIGAVVGVQPFGGEGLSGTGPKAGGPDYLRRFAVERTLTINTAAVGGNTSLLSLDEK